VDLRFFASNLFPGKFLDEKLMHWKRLLVHPFGEDCRTVARALLARLGDAEWVDVAALVDEYLDGPFRTEGFGPRAWTDQDDARVDADEKKRKAALLGGDDPDRKAPVAPPAAARSAPAKPLRSTIVARRTVEATDAGLSAALEALSADLEAAGETRDWRVDVEALRLEARRQQRRVDRMRGRVQALQASSGGDDAVARACARMLAVLLEPDGRGPP
jgi:hypothetical protein